MSLATGTFRPRGRKPRVPIRQPNRLNEGLVAAYVMAEGAGGSIRDFAGVAPDGIFSGPVGWGDSLDGVGLDFSGGTNRVDLGMAGIGSLLGGATAVTISGVCIAPPHETRRSIFSTTINDAWPGHQINIESNDSLFIRSKSRPQDSDQTLTVPVDWPGDRSLRWLVVFDYAASRLRVWANGHQIADQSVSYGSPEYVLGNPGSSRHDRIGESQTINPSAFPFVGQMSCVFVWRRALSNGETAMWLANPYEQFTPQIRRPPVVVPDLDVVRVTQLVRETLQAPASETQRITQVVREYLYSEGQRVTQFPVEMLISNRDPYHRVTQFVVEMLVSSDPRPDTYDIIRKANQGLGRGIIYG